MANENTNAQQDRQELNSEQMEDVAGGDSGDYLVWRKNFGAGDTSRGSAILPEVGWEVQVGFVSDDPGPQK